MKMDIQGEHTSGFGVVLADPPWSYRNEGVEGSAAGQYATLSAEQLRALPVQDLAADNSVLLLWATWPNLTQAIDLISAWGYTYVTGFPWVKLTQEPYGDLWGEVQAKVQYGIGFWIRGCTEPILIARRGNVSPSTGDFSGLMSKNFGHSRKPDNLYHFAERMQGPYLELFARRRREGWSSFGNELPGELL